MTLTEATTVITGANNVYGRSLNKFDSANTLNLLVALKPTDN